MRKFLVALVSIAIVLGAVMPAVGAGQYVPGRVFASSDLSKKKPPHKKHAKKTPTPARKGKPKKHKPKKHKPTPRPTAKPRRTSTPRPAPTHTPVPTPTFTLTPTITPTPTMTPTPTPLSATLALQSQIPVGYSAGFIVCGLPQGASATFAPNPSVSTDDASSPTHGSARSAVTVSVPYTVTRNQYALTFHAYYQNPDGVMMPSLPGGNITPAFAVMTVGTGSVSLAPADAVPADNGQNCSPAPLGFQPTPVPTPATSDYAITSWVSNPHPAAGETVTVYAKLTFHGQPVLAVPTEFTWYSFAVTRDPCQVATGADGTASCSLVNAYPLSGLPVTIEVTMVYGGYVFTSWTSYTM